MPPQKTQISCPQCRQPVVAIVEQLFDVSTEPGAKQRLLGGVSNFAACRSCGYSGPLATPIVYHDADKELLLTYFPPELKMPVNEQEKLVGPMITQVTNRLPAEKRKAYLLRPQSFLTYQSLIERILGADGITPEMIKAQQQKVVLIERLLSAQTPAARSEIIKSESAAFDEEFFAIFGRLLDSAAAGQETLASQMEVLQQQLMTETEYGQSVTSQMNEIQEAVKTLQAVGKELTREKLLEILIEAPGDERLNALVRLTRPGLDYTFFQSLTAHIETKSGEERKKLEALREKLLEITNRIDKTVEAEYRRAGELLNAILSAANVEEAMVANLDRVSEPFIRLLDSAMQEAVKKNDAAAKKKLQAMAAVLQQASAPPEVDLLEELLEAGDEAELMKQLEAHAGAITPEFASFVSGILARSQEKVSESGQPQNADILARLETVHRAVLKYSMKKNLG